MKDLRNLEGAKMISKNDQKSIKGGIPGDLYCNGILCTLPTANCCTAEGWCGELGPDRQCCPY